MRWITGPIAPPNNHEARIHHNNRNARDARRPKRFLLLDRSSSDPTRALTAEALTAEALTAEALTAEALTAEALTAASGRLSSW